MKLKRKPLSESTKKKVSIKLMGNHNGKGNGGGIGGEKHWNWKGDKVGYRTLHKWVEIHLGKANHCSKDINHKSTRYHWSNISKEYKRILTDWIQLCPSCNLRDRIGRRVSP
jgi:hypothetical protein